MVTAIDRISRRAVDGLRFIRDVTDAGIHLVVLSQREFDTATPTGQLLLHLTLAIAEWEWSNIRDRSIQGQQRARAEGKRIAREHRVHYSVVHRVSREMEETELPE